MHDDVGMVAETQARRGLAASRGAGDEEDFGADDRCRFRWFGRVADALDQEVRGDVRVICNKDLHVSHIPSHSDGTLMMI